MFFDTHCHIHEPGYKVAITDVEANNKSADLAGLICVGTDAKTSRQAVEFVNAHDWAWASVGLHPHDAKKDADKIGELEGLIINGVEQDLAWGSQRKRASATGESEAIPVERYSETNLLEGHHTPTLEPPANTLTNSGNRQAQTAPALAAPQGSAEPSLANGLHAKIIAVGECGLDYFYNNSPKTDQVKMLKAQIELAQKYDLPLIFHVREAFDDFWPIFDSYKNLRGVLHSYTDNEQNLAKALERNLFIGLNGIMTFTKNQWQLEVAKKVPLAKLLLETDAPFLTPSPVRGTVNEPANVRLVGEFLAKLRGERLEVLADATTKNAQSLFKLKL